MTLRPLTHSIAVPHPPGESSIRTSLLILAALALGLLAGIATGTASPLATEIADVVGTMWLNGLRMTVIPLVFALVVTGLVQTAAAARAGGLTARAAGLMILLLWTSAAIAALVTPALLAAFPLSEGARAALTGALGGAAPVGEVPPFGDFLRAIVPTNPVAAAAEDAILPFLLFTLAFAFAVTRLPADKRATIASVIEALGDAMLIVIKWVLLIAPLGVGAVAFTVGARAGSAAFGALAHYVAIVAAVGVLIWLLAFLLAMLGGRQRLTAFARATMPAQAVALSTQSSLASLPAMVEGTKALGIRPSTVDVVLPIAVAIFRVTGPAMNLAVAIYVAHWLNVELSPLMLATGVVVAAITTMGAVSLPGSISFVTSIAPINLAMGLPIEPLGLLVAIETFPDIVRTLGNVTMDMAVTTTVARADDGEGEAVAV